MTKTNPRPHMTMTNPRLQTTLPLGPRTRSGYSELDPRTRDMQLIPGARATGSHTVEVRVPIGLICTSSIKPRIAIINIVTPIVLHVHHTPAATLGDLGEGDLGDLGERKGDLGDHGEGDLRDLDLRIAGLDQRMVALGQRIVDLDLRNFDDRTGAIAHFYDRTGAAAHFDDRTGATAHFDDRT